MDIHLVLPRWMVERIVQILSDHPYTGAGDIIDTIRKQVDK